MDTIKKITMKAIDKFLSSYYSDAVFVAIVMLITFVFPFAISNFFSKNMVGSIFSVSLLFFCYCLYYFLVILTRILKGIKKPL